MGYGETPPPLPIKSSMGDYGNLMENPELASPTTPPPPHQRVKHTNMHRHPHTFLAVNEAIICNSIPNQYFQKFKMVIGSTSLTRSDTEHASDLCVLVNWLENCPVHTAWSVCGASWGNMNRCLIIIHYHALLTHFQCFPFYLIFPPGLGLFINLSLPLP